MSGFIIYNQQQTQTLLPYSELVPALQQAIVQYQQGQIISPPRLVTPLNQSGVMLSMPASAADLAMHKLVNVNPVNREQGLATIHGQVVVYNPDNGMPCFMLDGPTVTARRTAAISLLAIKLLSHTPPQRLAVIGCGKQALNHLEALAEIYPTATIYVKGRDFAKVSQFCADNSALKINLIPCQQLPQQLEVVITTTTSCTPVYDMPAQAGRLIVAVGSFQPDKAEIAAITLAGSQLFIDDPVGGIHEAGDFLLAGIDWQHVKGLAEAVDAVNPDSRPIVFKSVGCAAWDLAACRVAKQQLAKNSH